MGAAEEPEVLFGEPAQTGSVLQDPPHVLELGGEGRQWAWVVEKCLVHAREEWPERPLVLRRPSILVELPERHDQIGDAVWARRGLGARAHDRGVLRRQVTRNVELAVEGLDGSVAEVARSQFGYERQGGEVHNRVVGVLQDPWGHL